MSESRSGYSGLEGFERPLIYRVGWPEPISLSEGAIQAVLFEGFVDKKRFIDALAVNREERFLQLESFGDAVRVTSGDFIGRESRIASIIVKLDQFGSPIPPKRGIRRLIPGNNDAHCSWQQALAVCLNFAGFGPMPPGLAWWRGAGD